MVKNISYWRPEHYKSRSQPKKQDLSVDVAIIGGGITGVSAAYHLAQKGFKTVLMERDVLASSATGRNDGMLIEGTSLDLNEMIENFGRKNAIDIWNYTVKSRESILKAVDSPEDIGVERSGSLYVGKGKRDLDYLKHECKTRNRFGFKARVLDTSQINEMVSSRFKAALYTPGDCTVNPVKLVRRLASKAEEKGAIILEHSPVLRFDKNFAATAKVKVKAKGVFVAMEALNRQYKYGMYKRFLTTVTSRLPKEAIKRLHWIRGKSLWETRIGYSVIRPLGDRLMITSPGALIMPFEIDAVKLALRNKFVNKVLSKFSLLRFRRRVGSQLSRLVDYFPVLKKADIRPAYSWICYTRRNPNRLPFIGKINGIYQAFGYGGNGMTFGFLAGKIIAEHLDGKEIPTFFNTDPAKRARIH